MKAWKVVRQWLFPILIALGAFLAFTAAHEGVHGLSLDPKIKPYEILNLTITLLIAYFLQYYLAGRARDSRSEKDILIGNVKEVIQQLRTCRETVGRHDGKTIPKVLQKEIVSAFRRLSNDLLSVETVMSISDCGDITEKCRSMQTDVTAYKMTATGGKFPAAYSPASISGQEQAYRKLHKELHSLVFEINKHV